MENSSGTNVDSQKMKLILAVKAEKFEVDLVAGCLRVNGKNVKENKYVKVHFTVLWVNFIIFLKKIQISWVVIIHWN